MTARGRRTGVALSLSVGARLRKSMPPACGIVVRATLTSSRSRRSLPPTSTYRQRRDCRYRRNETRGERRDLDHDGIGNRERTRVRRRTPGRPTCWTQLWTQTRGEPQEDGGTKARPWPQNPRRRVTKEDRATLEGALPEVFETAPFDRFGTPLTNGGMI